MKFKGDTTKPMAGKTIQDVLDLVTSEDEVVDGVAVLIANLKQQVLDAANGTPEQQAAISAVFDKATSQKQKLADALIVNTPAA